MPLPRRALGFLLALSGWACGTEFVETQPPVLGRRVASYEAGFREEPTYAVLILDLFVADAPTCTAAHAWVQQSLTNALNAAGGATFLSFQDLSPACDQPASRRIDVAAIERATAQAVAARPDVHVRPVIVYANGLDLPLPDALRGDLLSIGDRLRSRGAQPAFLWLLARPVVLQSVPSDRQFQWTFALDPQVSAALVTEAVATFPLRTQIADQSVPVPLLQPGDPALWWKACDAPAAAHGVGFELDGAARPVTPGSPPGVLVTLAPQLAQPAKTFHARSVSVPLEVCTAHCERFYDYTPGGPARPWNRTQGCLLPAEAP